MAVTAPPAYRALRVLIENEIADRLALDVDNLRRLRSWAAGEALRKDGQAGLLA